MLSAKFTLSSPPPSLKSSQDSGSLKDLLMFHANGWVLATGWWGPPTTYVIGKNSTMDDKEQWTIWCQLWEGWIESFICAQKVIQKFPDYHPTSAGTGVKKKLLVKKQNKLFRIPAVTIGLSNCTRRPTLNCKYYIKPSFTQGENLEKSLLLMGAGQFTPNFHSV